MFLGPVLLRKRHRDPAWISLIKLIVLLVMLAFYIDIGLSHWRLSEPDWAEVHRSYWTCRLDPLCSNALWDIRHGRRNH